MTWELLGLGGLAASLLLCVGLFLSLKREIGTLRQRGEHDRRAWQQARQQQDVELKALRAELRSIDCGQQTLAPGLDAHTRRQAVRLHEAGHTPKEVAARLGAPEGEVALALKVHAIVLEHYAPAGVAEARKTIP